MSLWFVENNQRETNRYNFFRLLSRSNNPIPELNRHCNLLFLPQVTIESRHTSRSEGKSGALRKEAATLRSALRHGPLSSSGAGTDSKVDPHFPFESRRLADEKTNAFPGTLRPHAFRKILWFDYQVFRGILLPHRGRILRIAFAS